MKLSSIPKSGRKGSVVYVNSRHGKVARQYVRPRNPRTPEQQGRCVQHFPFLGLLAPPTDGWSDITELYVARYGVPKAGMAIWIRTCQHIDGWTDVPKVVRARVLATAA